VKSKQHTPGPWRVLEKGMGWWSLGVGGESFPDKILTVSTGKVPTEVGAANTVRIVACVNACDGLNPEVIAEVIGALREACTVAPRPPSEATVDAWLAILKRLRA